VKFRREHFGKNCVNARGIKPWQNLPATGHEVLENVVEGRPPRGIIRQAPSDEPWHESQAQAWDPIMVIGHGICTLAHQ
jgi:hypothetical protein